MQKAASNTRKTITVSHSAIRHFLARLHSLVAAVCRRYQCGINGFDSWGGSYGHCIQIGHFGVKLVNKRDFGDDRYGYGMICEN